MSSATEESKEIKPSHIPLHLHTEYSLLDGASRVPDICKKAAEAGMPAIAVTDHGNMYGTFELVQEAKKNGIKPIIGCEVYVVNGDHHERKKSKLYHLVLLAKNDNGYKNLIKIVSEAHVNGFYYKPRISKDYIRQYSEDLIALSACLGGEINNNTLNRKVDDEVSSIIGEYKDIFGDDFYLEIQDHKYPEDRYVNPRIMQLAKANGIKVVATNDSHFTDKEDAYAHDALLCLQMQKYVSDYPRMRFSGTEYVKTTEDMMQMFGDHIDQQDIKEAVVDNPMEIYNKITDEYKSFDGTVMHMPAPEIEEGYNYDDYLRKLVYEGAELKFCGEIGKRDCENWDEIEKRLEVELDVMINSGFSTYFIVVWDFIRWAREREIPVGPGRGSAAGSLIAFVLGITDIDPLKYDLLFERFLNPERKSMPDIDTDFCIERRGEVIEYVREKYGEDSVCQIITFNKMTSRAVIKDMARVLEMPYRKAEELAKMIPVVRGKPRKISWMVENHADFARMYKNDPEVRQVVDLAQKNEGLNKTYGVHAAGVIISDVPVDQVIPVSKSKDGAVITQFAMEEAAHMGLLKMDFLGLRNLTMIKNAVDLINENKRRKEGESFKKFNVADIPLDDKDTLGTICSGNLSGIFQLETSAGMKQVARDLNPQSLEDISALIALYRPGPLDTGMIDDFINRKSGKEKIVYDHPLLEPILKSTYGTIVYQEQIMKIAQVLAGFSLGEADLLRRAMGKKKPEVLLPFKDKFVNGCKENEISVELAEKLFEQMLAFAEYCFNKSHSTAYGMITYQTAYLKTHYPIEYLTSLFMSCSGDTDKIRFYINEAERLELKVTPPDINRSGVDFTCDVDNKEIIFGLSAIKGVGIAPTEEIIRIKEAGDFESFYGFCKRIDQKIVTKRTVEALIKSGAFDSLGVARKAMFDNLEDFLGKAKRHKEEEDKGQTNLFSFAAEETGMTDQAFSDDPSFANGTDDEFPERELQAMEYELLGLYVNNHPMSTVKDLSKILVGEGAKNKISGFESLKDGDKVNFTALISDFTKKLTKANKLIAILNLEDTEARTEGVLFSNKLEQFQELLEKGNRLVIEGTVSKRLEGQTSVMINSMSDLDSFSTLEFELDVNKIGDYFAFLHSLRTLMTQAENKGQHIALLKMHDSNDPEGRTRTIALDKKFAISDGEHVRKAINELIKKYSQPEVSPVA